MEGSPREQEGLRDDKGRFTPGHSGNPGGQRKRKPISEQLLKLLEQKNPSDPEGRMNLEIIADALINAANKGDLPAIREVIDRAEGKPTASVELSGGVDINGDARQTLAARIAAQAKRGKAKADTGKPD